MSASTASIAIGSAAAARLRRSARATSSAAATISSSSASLTAASTARSRSTSGILISFAQVSRFRCHEQPHTRGLTAWKLPPHSPHSRKPARSRFRPEELPTAVRRILPFA